MTIDSKERRLRKIAQKRGFMLRKLRGPLSRDNRGGYMIVDRRNAVVAGERFDLDLDAVAGPQSTWTRTPTGVGRSVAVEGLDVRRANHAEKHVPIQSIGQPWRAKGSTGAPVAARLRWFTRRIGPRTPRAHASSRGTKRVHHGLW